VYHSLQANCHQCFLFVLSSLLFGYAVSCTWILNGLQFVLLLIIITYSDCVSVAFDIQHAMRMRHIIWSFVAFRLPYFNLLTPNVNYSGRTALLTSKVSFYIFIQQIQVLNILNMVYTLRFFLFKMQFVS